MKTIFWIALVLIVLGLVSAILNLMVQLTLTMLVLGGVLLLAYCVAVPTDRDGY